LCWWHSLSGDAHIALDYCEQAVTLASNTEIAWFKDSRGVAYALTGEYQRAINDFEAFVQWSRANELYDTYGKKRQSWIDNLAKGINPFSAELLKELRNE